MSKYKRLQDKAIAQALGQEAAPEKPKPGAARERLLGDEEWLKRHAEEWYPMSEEMLGQAQPAPTRCDHAAADTEATMHLLRTRCPTCARILFRRAPADRWQE